MNVNGWKSEYAAVYLSNQPEAAVKSESPPPVTQKPNVTDDFDYGFDDDEFKFDVDVIDAEMNPPLTSAAYENKTEAETAPPEPKTVAVPAPPSETKSPEISKSLSETKPPEISKPLFESKPSLPDYTQRFAQNNLPKESKENSGADKTASYDGLGG
ncbi:hypothetical protein FACS1894188_07460 [Clostridia bacterium]|nr:hypothetical protein FACS1894188_07460 [Clostridia bacterium]